MFFVYLYFFLRCAGILIGLAALGFYIYIFCPEIKDLCKEIKEEFKNLIKLRKKDKKV